MASEPEGYILTETDGHWGTCHEAKIETENGKTSVFPDEALEHALAFVTSHKDRNAVSLVCKAWYKAEAWTRRCVFIRNCYSVSPVMMASRFPRIRSLALKTKPRFTDLNVVRPNWGTDVCPWIWELAKAGPFLEELRLKGMTVTDECLALLPQCFPNFRVLVLTACDGFSTDGLATICGNCRHLSELELQETSVDERGGNWIGCFPETCTSLTSLDFACLSDEVDFDALQRLVTRCSNLKCLKLGRAVSLEQMQQLLLRAPQLTELGTGSFSQDLIYSRRLENVILKCNKLKSLSGYWEVLPFYLPVIYPLCFSLTYLNLSYAGIQRPVFVRIINHCPLVQRLWVQDLVEDWGLEAAAFACNDLQELRVVPADPYGHGYVTEKGILAVSEGCPDLKYVLYFCRQMTDTALEAVARNCPKLTHFRLHLMTHDFKSMVVMDDGFGAIVKNCKDLQRLAVCGWLTDRAFKYIGMHGKKLQSLSMEFATDSDIGMQFVLLGCKKLRKLEIRDSPFGDLVLCSDLHRYPSMRSLWMSLSGNELSLAADTWQSRCDC